MSQLATVKASNQAPLCGACAAKILALCSTRDVHGLPGDLACPRRTFPGRGSGIPSVSADDDQVDRYCSRMVSEGHGLNANMWSWRCRVLAADAKKTGITSEVTFLTPDLRVWLASKLAALNVWQFWVGDLGNSRSEEVVKHLKSMVFSWWGTAHHVQYFGCTEWRPLRERGQPVHQWALACQPPWPSHHSAGTTPCLKQCHRTMGRQEALHLQPTPVERTTVLGLWQRTSVGDELTFDGLISRPRSCPTFITVWTSLATVSWDSQSVTSSTYPKRRAELSEMLLDAIAKQQ